MTEPASDEPVTGNVFDEKAKTWDDDPAKVERARVVAVTLRETLTLSTDTRVLEYGAGTGLVSQFLHDAVGPITMADTSAGMRSVIDDKIAAGVIPGGRVWDLDLGGEDVELDERFDLVVTVLTLHHVPDLDAVLANIAGVLDDGGHLVVVDLDKEDGSFHDDGFAGHHGFDHDHLAAALERAGFADVGFRPCHHIVKNGNTYPMFMATAVRPSRG